MKWIRTFMVFLNWLDWAPVNHVLYEDDMEPTVGSGYEVCTNAQFPL
ncbi:MAG: hypothetical protein WBI17_12805 [Clostridiaceae bacterium]